MNNNKVRNIATHDPGAGVSALERHDIIVWWTSSGLNQHIRSNRVEKGLFSIPAYLVCRTAHGPRLDRHACHQLLLSPARRYAGATGFGRITSSASHATTAGCRSTVNIRYLVVSEAGLLRPQSSRDLAGCLRKRRTR